MNYDFNWVNNVIFNWRHRTLDGGDNLSLINCINNYYKPGPATNNNAVKYRILLPQPKREKGSATTRPFGKAYVAGNVVVGNEQVTADNWNGGVQFPTSGGNSEEEEASVMTPELRDKLIAAVKLDKPLPMPPVTILSAEDAYHAVLDRAGDTLPKRDPVDERVVNEVRTGQVTYEKGIITDIMQVGGYPTYAGQPFTYPQNDGIPDWWKQKYHLDVNDPDLANKDCNGDGYTNLEKYLDGLDPTERVDWKDPKANVNTLMAAKLFGP
jgi:hypothetical protein